MISQVFLLIHSFCAFKDFYSHEFLNREFGLEKSLHRFISIVLIFFVETDTVSDVKKEKVVPSIIGKNSVKSHYGI